MKAIIHSIEQEYSLRDLSRRLAALLDETLFNKRNSIIYKQLSKYRIDLSINSYCYFSLENHGMVTPQKVSEKFESQVTKGLYNFIFSAEKLDKDKMVILRR